MKEWMLTRKQQQDVILPLVSEGIIGGERNDALCEVQARKIVDEIQEQMKVYLSSLAYREFVTSPYWKQLRKEVGL